MSLRCVRSCFALALCLALACDEAPVQDAKNPSAVAPPRSYSLGNEQGPVATTLSAPSEPRPDEEIALTLRIDRHLLAASSEVSVQLNLPEQVTLQRGALRTRVLPDSEPVAELHYALQASALPDEDATFIVTAIGDGFGYHAELPYRFGREDTLPERAERGASAVRVGVRDFGAAVRITPLR
jgi:hypothetical protein